MSVCGVSPFLTRLGWRSSAWFVLLCSGSSSLPCEPEWQAGRCSTEQSRAEQSSAAADKGRQQPPQRTNERLNLTSKQTKHRCGKRDYSFWSPIHSLTYAFIQSINKANTPPEPTQVTPTDKTDYDRVMILRRLSSFYMLDSINSYYYS
ncbi:hypothetical protein BKA64DRAFT_47163 [Cadophora sp. MPI-SDFR-AT-0126]|nr:hypothetical protein BKA64DRAFT_47163 [Leotiomycetes sp. MPI-SDFR-AT-0126]